jgi:CheY-like chemotaxis protein
MNDPAPRAEHTGAAGLFFVVERDVHMRRLIADFLAPLPCAVRFFDDGYSALDAVRRDPPRLVVTDILVPKLDGLALCRLIKRDEALRGVKVVILSAVSAEERARESGADAFLDKPIERERITVLVRTLTGLYAPEERP